MCCSGCGSEYIVNKKYNLCDVCNYIRLHGESRFSAITRKAANKRLGHKISKKGYNSINTEKKRVLTLRKDRETYYKVFISNMNECQECATPLNSIFEDEQGRIINIWQYSHILSKGSAPHLRHDYRNFNRLCFSCHQQWEFGDRTQMKIYGENLVTIQKLRDDSTLATSD